MVSQIVYFAYTKIAKKNSDVNDPFEGALISIGPHTDAMVERFRFDDSIVRRLRILTQTVRSSQWEEVLCTDPKWGLTFQQAVKISEALCLDITGRALVSYLEHPLWLYSDVI